MLSVDNCEVESNTVRIRQVKIKKYYLTFMFENVIFA